MGRPHMLFTVLFTHPSTKLGHLLVAMAAVQNGTSFKGFCEKTKPGGDCQADRFGSWQLPTRMTTWHVADHFCIQRCLRCERCNFVSLSLRHHDCSWFEACDLQLLQSQPSGFRTYEVKHGVATKPCVSKNESSSVVKLYSSASTPSLELLTYDSREAADRFSSGVYSSARRQHLALSVGKLEGARCRRYRSADKPTWLLRVLPSWKSGVVMMVDATDMMVLCGEDELLGKWRTLTDGDANSVVVGGEPILWPDQQRFDGHLLLSNPVPYPQPTAHLSPLRWINCGLLLGTPDAVLRLLQCMRDRYEGFPDSCPADVSKDGRHPSNFSDATHYKRTWRDKTTVFTKGGWGWDQACYHTYMLEQVTGLLPRPRCPKLIVDYRADVVLSIGGMAQKLDWQAAPGRVAYNVTGAQPCVLHGNGPKGKPLFQKAQRWWDKQEEKRRRPVRPGAHTTGPK